MANFYGGFDSMFQSAREDCESGRKAGGIGADIAVLEVPRPRPSPLPLSRPTPSPAPGEGCPWGVLALLPLLPGRGTGWSGEEGRGDEGLGWGSAEAKLAREDGAASELFEPRLLQAHGTLLDDLGGDGMALAASRDVESLRHEIGGGELFRRDLAGDVDREVPISGFRLRGHPAEADDVLPPR